MKMKTITVLVLVVGGPSGAYAASDFGDTAQVVSSTPIIERVAEQRQECDTVPAPQRSSNNILGPIIGGVLGGLLGHQIGHGSGQTAATIIRAARRGPPPFAIINPHRAPNAEPCRTLGM